jgi:spermidine/putrescine transport system ATP-binding protein
MTFDLECRDVVKHFGDFAAVAGVSLAVPKGSFFSILGPSGCGKTTLMRMIAGFAEPTSGDILIGGRSVLSTPPNKRAVNMVFQHLALFPMMSVAENIGYGLRRRGLPREDIRARVDAVLGRIGLPDAGPRRIGQLSGGQKQRVAIARCMVLDPTVLLLDEPLGALDLKLREHMKLELKQVQAQFGTTFVYITHDQSEALVMSDQVAVMNAGRFEQTGTPQELYYRPATPFVAGFVGDSHRWKATVEAADGDRLVLRTETGLRLEAVAGKTGQLRTRDPVVAYARAESFLLLAPDTAGPARPGSRLRAVLASVLFNGANSRAVLRLDNGEEVATGLTPALAQAPPPVGTPLDILVPTDQLIAFPEGNQA